MSTLGTMIAIVLLLLISSACLFAIVMAASWLLSFPAQLIAGPYIDLNHRLGMGLGVLTSLLLAYVIISVFVEILEYHLKKV
jgi:hypothetical protein